MAALSFRPGAAATLCTAAALAALLALGTWQVQRLQWKSALIATVEARAAEPPVPLEAALADPDIAAFRPVTAVGAYRHDLAFAMGTRGSSGEVGAGLVTPLALPDGQLLLVERGWLPEALLPPATPSALQPAGEVRLGGRLRDLRAARAGLFTPANQPDRRRWFWYDLAAIAELLGAPVLPFALTLDASDTGAELPRPTPLPVSLLNNHLGYAITWYGLAAGLVAVYVAFGLRRTGD